jgi:hypothetical protein
VSRSQGKGNNGFDWLIPYSWGAIGIIAILFLWNKYVKGWIHSIEWMSQDFLIKDEGFVIKDFVITGLLWLLLFLGIAFCALFLLNRYHRYRARKDVRCKKIILHANTQHDGKGIERLINALWEAKRSWFKRLIFGREWIQFLIHSEKGEHPEGDIYLYIAYPQDRDPYIKKELLNIYPTAELFDIPHKDFPKPFLNKGFGGRLDWQYSKQPGLPLRPFEGAETISHILTHLNSGTYVSLVFSPVSVKKLNEKIEETRDAVIHKRKGSKFSFLKPYMDATLKVISNKDISLDKQDEVYTDDVKEVIDKLRKRHESQSAFDVAIYVWHEADDRRPVDSLVNAINTTVKRENRLRIVETKKSPFDLAPYPKEKEVMTWTGLELANLFHLPKGKTKYEKEKRISHIMDRIPHVVDGQDRIGPNEFLKGIPFGYFIHPAYAKRMLYIAEKKLRKMALVLGKIGSGKTALILMMLRLHLIWKLVKNEPLGGLTFIDPKGDGVLTALTYFRMLHIQGHEFDESKVHYFDLSSDQYSVGLNLLERLPEQDEDKQIANIIAILQNAYPNESAWVKKYARPTIKALLRDKYEQHTILAIPEFLRKESPLRDRIKAQLKKGNTDDVALYRKLEELEDKFGGHEVEPLLNRLDELLESPVTQRIFGQKKTSLEIRRYIEEGHFVFFNAEGLAENEAAMKIVMGTIVTLYHQAAQQRQNKAQNHYLVVDEAHQCQIPVLYQQILPKDRSKGLIAILMTQYMDQLVTPLKQAIKEVSGHMFAFTCGQETAREVQKFTGDRFKAEDIINMPELHAGVYTENESGQKVTFRIKVEPPYIMGSDGKPTYYGEDERRQAREEREAFQGALKLGLNWMKRDCLSVKDAQNQVNEYRKQLWELDKHAILWGSESETEQKEAEQQKPVKQDKEQEYDVSILAWISEEEDEDDNY